VEKIRRKKWARQNQETSRNVPAGRVAGEGKENVGEKGENQDEESRTKRREGEKK